MRICWRRRWWMVVLSGREPWCWTVPPEASSVILLSCPLSWPELAEEELSSESSESLSLDLTDSEAVDSILSLFLYSSLSELDDSLAQSTLVLAAGFLVSTGIWARCSNSVRLVCLVLAGRWFALFSRCATAAATSAPPRPSSRILRSPPNSARRVYIGAACNRDNVKTVGPRAHNTNYLHNTPVNNIHLFNLGNKTLIKAFNKPNARDTPCSYSILRDWCLEPHPGARETREIEIATRAPVLTIVRELIRARWSTFMGTGRDVLYTYKL